MVGSILHNTMYVSIQVGDANSGKSSIVHVLAQLTGHKVVEFPVNSSMDTTDLVGGYVQVQLAVVQCSRGFP